MAKVILGVVYIYVVTDAFKLWFIPYLKLIKQYSFGGKSLGRTMVMMFGKTMVNKMGQRNLLWG